MVAAEKTIGIIIKKEMIEVMPSGSIIYDLAASQGGNSELTKVNEIVDIGGVKIMGETNILNKLPISASNLFSKNIYNASNSSFEIILEKDSIFEERELFVLAKFNLDENWHTYWINPGDSGEPVNFDWILPEGFKISDPIWPSPELIPYPPLTTFGYTNELTLLFKISIPENIKKINELSVTSRWLVCADVCIPQEGTVNFSLNEGNYSQPSDVIDAINEVKTKIPEKINNPIPIKIEKNQLFIDLDFLNTKTDEVIFFPFQENILDYSVTQRLENNSEKIILVATLDNYGITSELTGGVLKTKDASYDCLLYTSPSPRDRTRSRMPSSA